MNQRVAGLGAINLGIHAASIAHGEIRPDQTHTALAAIEDAKVLVAAGRGQLLLVGSALTTDQAPSENVVVILEYPTLRDMKAGMILILARNGCEPIESCLIARRVSEVGVRGDVQTDPYTTEGLLFGKTQATLLGVVSYAIDLETDRIRDMRAGRKQESVTLAQALAQQAVQTRGRAN
jgi:hypothetical protein